VASSVSQEIDCDSISQVSDASQFGEDVMAVPARLWLLILGWVLALLGGVLGILIGVHLLTAKITDLDGKKTHQYTGGSRMQGLFMIILGIIVSMVVGIALNS
jgi:hypothetical protein